MRGKPFETDDEIGTRRVFEFVCTTPITATSSLSSPTMGATNLLILLACIGVLHGM